MKPSLKSCHIFRAFLLILGCDGVVGSSARYDQCGVCRGDNSSCRLVSGLFTKPHLPPGHSALATIPKHACSINITFFRTSNNHIALRSERSGYILNGPGSPSESGVYQAGGSAFLYTRGQTGSRGERENLASDGPLTEPLALELEVSDLNRGVEYRYMIPSSEEPENLNNLQFEKRHRRRHSKRQYRWSQKTLTPCTRSCGGGYQSTVAICVRRSISSERVRVVSDTKCDSKDRPESRTMRCNRSPCPAQWEPDKWSACSASCGPGQQERRLVCRQKLSDTLTVPVPEAACLSSSSLNTIRKCFVRPCENITDFGVPTVKAIEDDLFMQSEPAGRFSNFLSGGFRRFGNSDKRYSGSFSARNARKYSVPQMDKPQYHEAKTNVAHTADWVAQAWGQCSVTCGSGIKERRVHCVDTRGGLVPDSRCQILTRPESETFCHAGPCITDTWLVSQWDVCSSSCGPGKVHRKVVCFGKCDPATKPHQTEDCQAAKSCEGEWLTGRWSVCSHSCGPGNQTRTVECTVIDQGVTGIARESECSNRRKPKVERNCNIQKCSSQWFTAEWSKCSRLCGDGEQTREVVCLLHGARSDSCRLVDRPGTEQPCRGQHCHASSTSSPGQLCQGQNCGNSIDMGPGTICQGGECTTVGNLTPEPNTTLRPATETTSTPKVDWETELESHGVEGSGYSQTVEEEKQAITESEEITGRNNEIPAVSKNVVENFAKLDDENSILSNEILPEKHWKTSKSGSLCKDKFKNCNAVVQSRLCNYSYYQTNCCRSCRFLNT